MAGKKFVCERYVGDHVLMSIWCSFDSAVSSTFRQICCKMEEECLVAQPAPGFPKGWSFFFKDRKSTGVVLVGPGGTEFSSVDAAVTHCGSVYVDVGLFCQFLEGLGADSAATSTAATTFGKTVGARVYCRWPENKNFYWGTIIKRFFKQGRKKPLFKVSSQSIDTSTAC